MDPKKFIPVTVRLEKVFKSEEELTPGLITEISYPKLSEALKKLKESKDPPQEDLGRILTPNEISFLAAILDEFDGKLPTEIEDSFDIVFFSLYPNTESNLHLQIPE
ncbi:MAG: hypothetical protein P4L51_28550 [Puia sp.]|nr:hypothetical protein [Puia sp.]